MAADLKDVLTRYNAHKKCSERVPKDCTGDCSDDDGDGDGDGDCNDEDDDGDGGSANGLHSLCSRGDYRNDEKHGHWSLHLNTLYSTQYRPKV